MPELPDVAVYVEHVAQRCVGRCIERIVVVSPFVVRTVSPTASVFVGAKVAVVQRIGKRIAIGCLDSTDPSNTNPRYFLVIHLMVAGRLQWKAKDTPVAKKVGLAKVEFADSRNVEREKQQFPDGALLLTEASTKKRASIHLVDIRLDPIGLSQFDRGGLEPIGSSLETFAEAIRRENHTMKRTLTDPRLFSGIGNAYSDEILHRAKCSPIALSKKLTDTQIAQLHVATNEVLAEWTNRLRREAGDHFPEKVTAFRPEMAVHGKFGQSCPVCGTKIQRIVFADNEHNYCPTCQTGGKILADRALSRLLGKDWPRSLDELDQLEMKRANVQSVRELP